MKVTLGDRLGAELDKFRLQLPTKAAEPKPVVGVVVPANGRPIEDPTTRSLVMAAALGEAVIKGDLQHQPLPQLDEGQAVGEFIEWLDRKGMLPAEFSSNFDFAKNAKNRLKLQQWYFKECAQ